MSIILKVNKINNENFSDTDFDQDKYEKKLHESRTAVLGTLTGLIIVTIVMVAVGQGAWWSYIAILAVGYGLFDQIVEYQLHKRNASKGEINAIKAMTGAWFGFILVSFIMDSIFGFFNWIALIVEISTLCGAVYTTMDYYNSKRRNFQKLKESTDSDDIESYQEPIRSETNDIKSEDFSHYCSLCGTKTSGSAEYCPSCGEHL